MYMRTGSTVRRESLGMRLGLQIGVLSMRGNMTHDNHSGREKHVQRLKVAL